MSTDAGNPYWLSPSEHALWVAAGRPLGQDYREWSALVNGIKTKAADTARKSDARIEAAGKIEEAASQEAYWRWEADQLDEDARLTTLLLETEAAVEAEREAWQAKQARMNQLGQLGP